MGIGRRFRGRLDHRWARRRMSDYLDDRLGLRQRRRLERHTEICPECRRVLRTLATLVRALGELRGGREAPAAPGILERVRAEPPAGETRWDEPR